ncbi:hypothetical protein GALMADRAFT_69292 [Galerina marginata CBS 339.88]|uniref:E3 ubiquitin protein ligase n=1 Tax=Galerina marginata (strain CBS 339.88) TaxID=685588 RepID=A0A067SYP2_GALM3|nr:hypothetical protein GALMADRAFT_69292 [Galerina marginata CBS 339.88]
MDSRKRPLVDDDEPVITKKRIVTGANGGPHVNGVVEIDDEGYTERIESYRKEAIYRKMKHYSREHERSKARIQELEHRKTTCEAGLAAISACWAQLVDTIRLIVKPDDVPQITIRSKEIFDLTSQIQNEPLPHFKAALGDTVNATQALVTKFVQLGDNQQSRLLQSEGFSECQKAQNECALLRSEIQILRARLEDSETQRENYRDALIATENRLARSQSVTVREIETRGPVKQETRTEEKEDVREKPSPSVSALSPVQTNGNHDNTEMEILLEQLTSRDTKIIELEKEAALLRDQKTMMELEHKAPSLEQINESPYYKVLLNHASHLEASLVEKSEQIYRLQEEILQLQALRSEWQEHETANLRNMLTKRDAENARLREQREQQGAELNERRHKDSVKIASLQEYKLLVESNSERINILQSELSRCKAQLAANAGSEELMVFFLGGNIDEVRFFEGLKEQKSQAESRVAALEQTFSIYQDDHPDIVEHMKAEAEAIQQLSQVNAALERYKQTYGTLSTLPPEVSQLAEQVRIKELELESLRLAERQRQENESSLFGELEKLSALWESLDRQLKSKVLDLSSLEDRLNKSAVDKAKSDNKYFAAMRDKEAIENERKILAKTVEKQEKVVDRFTAVEKQLKNQLGVLEKESVTLKKCCETLKDRVLRLEKETPELQTQLEGEKKRVHELNLLFNERESYLHVRRSELRTREDDFIRAKKDLEKQIAHLRTETRVDMGSSSKSDPVDVELKRLRALAVCTTCHETYRTTIITKCMHSGFFLSLQFTTLSKSRVSIL